jgi:hypothetical protein
MTRRRTIPPILAVLLLSLSVAVFLLGCRFAATSLFPLRLAYVEKVIGIDQYLEGSAEGVEMNVLFNGQEEYLFVLDEQAVPERRLVVFDKDLERVYSGAASEEVVGGEFGRLMTVAADLSFVVGNVAIAPDYTFAPAGDLLLADSRVGLSNYSDTNWTLEITNDGSYFQLRISEYDGTWTSTGSAEEYPVHPYSADLNLSVENALYLGDSQEIAVVLHLEPENRIFFLLFDEGSFPDSLTPPTTTSWIEEGLYVAPLPQGVEDVARGSVAFTADGIVYYDRDERRLKRIFEGASNLPLDTESGDPSFAFSLFGEEFYYIDPGRGELYKMKTWW